MGDKPHTVSEHDPICKTCGYGKHAHFNTGQLHGQLAIDDGKTRGHVFEPDDELTRASMGKEHKPLS